MLGDANPKVDDFPDFGLSGPDKSVDIAGNSLPYGDDGFADAVLSEFEFIAA